MKVIRNAAAKEASLYLYEDIGSGWFGGVSSKSVADELKALGDLKKLTVHINSPGGSVFEGVAIYNILRQAAPLIHVRIDGLAASIASLVAMAGTAVTMADNAMLMIHDPWGMAVGSATELRKQADTLDAIRGTLVDTYARRTRQPSETISDWMSDETWMDARTAMERGFVDGLDEPDQMAAHFDLSRYRYRAVPDAYANRRSLADHYANALRQKLEHGDIELKIDPPLAQKISREAVRDMLSHMKAASMRHRLDRINPKHRKED